MRSVHHLSRRDILAWSIASALAAHHRSAHLQGHPDGRLIVVIGLTMHATFSRTGRKANSITAANVHLLDAVYDECLFVGSLSMLTPGG